MVLVGSDSGYFLTTRWGKFCRLAEDTKQETLGVRGVQRNAMNTITRRMCSAYEREQVVSAGLTALRMSRLRGRGNIETLARS